MRSHTIRGSRKKIKKNAKPKVFKVDGTVSQRCKSKFKTEVRISIPAYLKSFLLLLSVTGNDIKILPILILVYPIHYKFIE